MRVCAAYGISHSHFLGGPASWTQADRDKAIWWDIQQRETCQSCGQRPKQLEEDPASYSWKVESCPGCELREKGQRTATQRLKAMNQQSTGLEPWQWVAVIRDRKGAR